MKLETPSKSLNRVCKSAPIKSFKCAVQVKFGILTMPLPTAPSFSLFLKDFSLRHISVFSAINIF